MWNSCRYWRSHVRSWHNSGRVKSLPSWNALSILFTQSGPTTSTTAATRGSAISSSWCLKFLFLSLYLLFQATIQHLKVADGSNVDKRSLPASPGGVVWWHFTGYEWDHPSVHTKPLSGSHLWGLCVIQQENSHWLHLLLPVLEGELLSSRSDSKEVRPAYLFENVCY